MMTYGQVLHIEKRLFGAMPVLIVAQPEEFSYRRDEAENSPTVIVIHGLSSRKERHLDFCVALARASFRAVAVDAAFHGDRRDREMLGQMEDSRTPEFHRAFAETVQTTIADIRALCDELKLERFGILGHSMGGYIATLVAATDIRAAATINIAGSLAPVGTELSLPADIAALSDLTTGFAARAICPRPILLLHGALDNVVLPRDADIFHNQLRAAFDTGEFPHCAELRTFPDAGHELDDKMVEQSVVWMTQQLRPATLDSETYRRGRIQQNESHNWFTGELEAAKQSRRSVRHELKAAIRPKEIWEDTALAPQVQAVTQLDGYRRESVTFTTLPGLRAFGYLLVPDNLPDTPKPAVLCVPGHGRGVNSIVGIAEDGTQRKLGQPDEYQQDFALESVRRGYVTFALEQISFGHRRDAQARAASAGASSCTRDSMAALMVGETMMGWRVWDAMRALDYLQTRASDLSLDGRFAMLGISGGGATTLFTAALDERIKAAIVSGYFNTFAGSILAVDHCVDNYVPDLLNVAEMPDIAGTIAPRALLVEGGSDDKIFPRASFDSACERTAQIYAQFEASEKFVASRFEGGHVWSGADVWPFLDAQLGS